MAISYLTHEESLRPPASGRYTWQFVSHFFNVIRRSCPAQVGWDTHDHDFYEALWITEGSLQHHDAFGQRSLHAGDCLFVRPEHRHAAYAGEHGAAWVNIALAPVLWSPSPNN